MNADELNFDNLPLHVQRGINDSIKQATKGELISFEKVKKEISAILNLAYPY